MEEAIYLHITTFPLPSKLILSVRFLHWTSFPYLFGQFSNCYVLIIVFFTIFCDKAERFVFVFGKHGKHSNFRTWARQRPWPSYLNRIIWGFTVVNLFFVGQCGRVIAKAKGKLVVIRRSLKLCNSSVKESAYFSFVGPPPWSTLLQPEQPDLSWYRGVVAGAGAEEGSKIVCNTYNNYNVSSSELVLSLDWEALGVRRLYNQTVLIYKFYNG